jgi:hypothetical protein
MHVRKMAIFLEGDREMNEVNFEKAMLLQIECEMNGMVAENKQREKQGQSMAYGMDSFEVLINRIEGIIKR